MRKIISNHDIFALPRFAARLLRMLLPVENRESVMGDYEEMFADLAGRKGRLAARAWYGAQVFKSVPMFVAGIFTGRMFMLKTDFKLAVRNMRKAKGFTFLNIAGLALGMAVGFLMLLFVFQETSFDRFHEKSDRIFRFSNRVRAEDRQMDITGVPGPFGPLLADTFPEVANVARLRTRGTVPVILDGRSFEIRNALYADPGFFDVFSARVIGGDQKTMLEVPFSLVLTDETAQRLFGKEDPVGRIVQVNRKDPYTVTGVVRKFPSNSHLRFDALVSLSTREKLNGDVGIWLGFNFKTYVELRPGAAPAALLPRFQEALDDNADPAMKESMNITTTLGLTPLKRIHLHSHAEDEIVPPGNPAYIRILALIAFFILLLAGINFVTLSTARAGRRAKEIGIRKVLGAERRRLVGQFLGESVLLSCLSLSAAIGIIYFLLPLFNRLIAQDLSFQPFRNGIVLIGLLGLAVVIGLLAGIYPALVLSGFTPQRTLKANTGPGRERRFLRNGLVTFQYAVSIALICCTLIVYHQLKFLRTYDLGYNRNQLVEVPLLGQTAGRSDIFKAEVLKIPGVQQAAICSASPYAVGGETLFRFEGAPAGDRQVLPLVETDCDFLPTLGLSLAAGRNFDRERPADQTAALINQTLARKTGWDNPLGKTIYMTDVDENREFIETPVTVIGVVKDYHFESLHTPLRGQIILNRPARGSNLLVKLREEAIPASLAGMERAWKALEPNRPFGSKFLSEAFDRLYRTEQRLGQVFIFFTLLALFVAGLGLFGLAAYTAERRTREIGIRKILGASAVQIAGMLSREFVRWVLLANLLAWPAAYLAMRTWSASFPYRPGFNPLLFVAAGTAALLLAALTVSLRTMKTSRATPVKSLRYE
ncbi:MAG: ABC transporter permease [Candidatus Aminicenantes bacterium]|nr:ABC transporter permease [Candidatus Aminicenantes bacterium]